MILARCDRRLISWPWSLRALERVGPKHQTLPAATCDYSCIPSLKWDIGLADDQDVAPGQTNAGWPCCHWDSPLIQIHLDGVRVSPDPVLPVQACKPSRIAHPHRRRRPRPEGIF